MTTYGYAGRDLGSEEHWVIPQIPQQQALLRLVAERSRSHPPGAEHTRRFSMYTSKDIAEAIEKIPADDLDVTAIAWCDLHDRITRKTGLSEEAVRQTIKKECLLWIEKMRQFGEGMLSGKVVPLAIRRQG